MWTGRRNAAVAGAVSAARRRRRGGARSRRAAGAERRASTAAAQSGGVPRAAEAPKWQAAQGAGAAPGPGQDGAQRQHAASAAHPRAARACTRLTRACTRAALAAQRLSLRRRRAPRFALAPTRLKIACAWLAPLRRLPAWLALPAAPPFLLASEVQRAAACGIAHGRRCKRVQGACARRAAGGEGGERCLLPAAGPARRTQSRRPLPPLPPRAPPANGRPRIATQAHVMPPTLSSWQGHTEAAHMRWTQRMEHAGDRPSLDVSRGSACGPGRRLCLGVVRA
jgi:hypothetical protein